MSTFSRHNWAEKLALELERPHVLIDYGYIVIWLDRLGCYNHATAFGKGARRTIVISRFAHLAVDLNKPDNPVVCIDCLESEAMALTTWVVDWSRATEAHTPTPLTGLVLLTYPPLIVAHTVAYYREGSR